MPCEMLLLRKLQLSALRRKQMAFQQDGAAIHRSKATQKFLKDIKFRQHNGGQWPPNPPDLNPIEHIWPAVGKVLEGQTFGTRDKLWQGIKTPIVQVPP